MSGFMQPEPLSREAARELLRSWRAAGLAVISVISPDHQREYALASLWVYGLERLNQTLPVLWADDVATEYGYISVSC
jgi:hypothetical protein